MMDWLTKQKVARRLLQEIIEVGEVASILDIQVDLRNGICTISFTSVKPKQELTDVDLSDLIHLLIMNQDTFGANVQKGLKEKLIEFRKSMREAGRSSVSV